MNIHPGSESLCVFELIRTTWQEWVSREWVTLQCLRESEPLMKMGEHASSLWVTLWCLSESELIRMDEHAWIQSVSCSPVSEGLEPLRKLGMDKHIQLVSHSPVFEGIRTTDVNVNTYSEWVALQCFSGSEPLTEVKMHPGSESFSSVSVDLNYWRWLILHLECNYFHSLSVTSLTSFRALIWRHF